MDTRVLLPPPHWERRVIALPFYKRKHAVVLSNLCIPQGQVPRKGASHLASRRRHGSSWWRELV